ncbi:MAG: RDD family protein [Nitrospirae bacterium]|nr:RDD family protein [Nitrospirota bacterium]MCL5284476.1 RDD family protein [Nitrospirota bacterium]
MIGRRILAFWLDLFLAIFLSEGGLSLLRREILSGTDPEDPFDPVRQWAAASFHPAALLAGLFLYFFLFWAISSETPGQSLFGLTVIRDSGDAERVRIGPGGALRRTLVFGGSFLLLGLGFLAALANDRRLALHDCLSGTRVVRERSRPAPRPAELP